MRRRPTTMAKDYYGILGVSRDATADEVKAAYRRLAREHHPDVRRDDPHAEERFKEINEAYAVLGDPQRRAQYDRFGRVGDLPAPPADVFSEFDDLLEMFFGTGSRRARSRRPGTAVTEAPATGADLRYDLEVTLEEAATGIERAIQFPRLETCSACFGTGRERGSAPETCPTCRGAGEIRHQRQTVFGYFTQVATCRQCGGAGTIIRHPCAECDGTGRREATREVTVKIPAGVEAGMRLRLTGEGEAGLHGGPRGDLYVVVHLRPHPVFTRDGADLYCEVPISMVQAALGDEISVPAIDGPVTIALPPGAQHGARLRLRGKGMPDLSGTRGDLFARLRVEIPSDLTPEQRDLLLEFAKSRGERVQPQRKSLWKKMRELLQ